MELDIHVYVHQDHISPADVERLERVLKDTERNTIRLEQVAKALKRLDRQTP